MVKQLLGRGLRVVLSKPTEEMMKADIDTTVTVTALHDIFRFIWEEERIPEDWSKVLIVNCLRTEI